MTLLSESRMTILRETSFFRHMANQRFLLALLLLVLHLPAGASALRVGVEDASPPKWQDYVGDRPTGFCADLIDQLAQARSGLAFQLAQLPLPQKRMEADLQEGRIDLICGLTRTPQRTNLFVYIPQPIYTLDYVLFARADDPVAPRNWDDVRALGNEGIILLNYDSSAVGRLQREGNLQLDSTARTVEQNLRKLQSGKGRFFFYIRQGGWSEAKRMEFENQLRVVEPAFDRQPFHLLIGRHVPLERRDALQEALKTLESSGRLQLLQRQWGLQ